MIRTSDPLLPKQLRYQAALHPDELDIVATEVAGAAQPWASRCCADARMAPSVVREVMTSVGSFR